MSSVESSEATEKGDVEREPSANTSTKQVRRVPSSRGQKSLER
eukprot:CAMPEP_0197702646 /NCGR_PEP_ID=MMETSP1338-20131121/124780_1 /TAXON_ID=43686 ORGANISM="Pelagodinium beii, Strain RCC1491" /NCGR_SAMPLE_ID=MMETSP1338 /ASSEMBLY_ACC=CAM_ASM_000754 /LENGTH=42 /DNA_ID= /DNA_START= /DNA_END= /DNA_ORIENTATION=